METETFTPIDIELQCDVEEAAKALRCSPHLIDMLGLLMQNITDKVSKDLKDIWQRLDEAGI